MPGRARRCARHGILDAVMAREACAAMNYGVSKGNLTKRKSTSDHQAPHRSEKGGQFRSFAEFLTSRSPMTRSSRDPVDVGSPAVTEIRTRGSACTMWREGGHRGVAFRCAAQTPHLAQARRRPRLSQLVQFGLVKSPCIAGSYLQLVPENAMKFPRALLMGTPGTRSNRPRRIPRSVRRADGEWAGTWLDVARLWQRIGKSRS